MQTLYMTVQVRVSCNSQSGNLAMCPLSKKPAGEKPVLTHCELTEQEDSREKK